MRPPRAPGRWRRWTGWSPVSTASSGARPARPATCRDGRRAVIPRVHRCGASVAEVLHYLFGPGEYRDHHRPRVIAAWAYATVGGVDELQPGTTTAGGRRVLRRLVELLEPPVAAGVQPPPKPVWHCSLHNHADDAVLSDQQWAQIAAQFMAGVGLAPHGDLGAVRWLGIRHGDNHVHLVATL